MADATTTGEPELDLVLECGPRMFNHLTPSHVGAAIAKSPSLHWFNLHLTQRAIEERLRLLAVIRQIGRENREIEWKATDGLGLPYCRIPPEVIVLGERLCGPDCWADDKFLEDFLDAYPECRIKVTRGTRGQEYVGRR